MIFDVAELNDQELVEDLVIDDDRSLVGPGDSAC